MSPTVCATDLSELDAISRLLASTFGGPVAASAFTLELLRWKYFAPRPDWQGSRSFILKEGGQILAHAGIWPIRFLGPAGPVGSMQVIDWIGSPQHPGAGSFLRREINELADTAVGIGGTAQARRARQTMGFRPWAELRSYWRPIRPRARFLHATGTTLPRRVMRLARDSVLAAMPRSRAQTGWTARPVEAFDATIAPALPRSRDGTMAGYRDPGLLNYLLGCPAASCRGFVLEDEGVIRGFFLVSVVGRQSRIADIWIDRGTEQDWRAALRLATDWAADRLDVTEIAATASRPELDRALRQNGFRRRRSVPIALLDRQEMLAVADSVHLQYADYDAFFLV